MWFLYILGLCVVETYIFYRLLWPKRKDRYIAIDKSKYHAEHGTI